MIIRIQIKQNQPTSLKKKEKSLHFVFMTSTPTKPSWANIGQHALLSVLTESTVNYT